MGAASARRWGRWMEFLERLATVVEVRVAVDEVVESRQ